VDAHSAEVGAEAALHGGPGLAAQRTAPRRVDRLLDRRLDGLAAQGVSGAGGGTTDSRAGEAVDHFRSSAVGGRFVGIVGAADD
jgi:hypothetical protein